MPHQRRASAAFALVTLGLDAQGVGIVAPIVPGLVRDLGHLSPDKAAPWIGALIASYAAMQFFAAPILGALSDRFGRRPFILASVFGVECDYVLLALAPNLWLLFVGRLIAGATSANVAAVTAYISDVSDVDDRSRRFGLIGATFGVGFVVGPALGGLLGAYSLRLPFVAAAAALSFSNVCFGLFVLPESLEAGNRRAITWARAAPFKPLMGAVCEKSMSVCRLRGHARGLDWGRCRAAWCCLPRFGSGEVRC
jgi:DHA1 family tetracycline resistance protein-like MFS transporter